MAIGSSIFSSSSSPSTGMRPALPSARTAGSFLPPMVASPGKSAPTVSTRLILNAHNCWMYPLSMTKIRAMVSRSRLIPVLHGVLALLIALAACESGDSPVDTNSTEEPSAYAGSASCQPCHESIYADYAGSGHAEQFKRIVGGQPPQYVRASLMDHPVTTPPPGTDWDSIAFVLGGTRSYALFVGTDSLVWTAEPAMRRAIFRAAGQMQVSPPGNLTGSPAKPVTDPVERIRRRGSPQTSPLIAATNSAIRAMLAGMRQPANRLHI